mmetsp:Transcript_40077/g.69175  ORF Transcript_40077/g.69175 Transcript_40077/m.69175 type:complete len:268 (-) Transcript_40077:97-900(-)
MDTRCFLANQRGLEQDLRASEALIADDNNVAIGKLVALLQGRRLSGGLHLLVKVQGHIGELFLDVPHNLTLGGGGEGVPPLRQDLHKVVSQVPASQIQPHNCVRKSVALVDGHGVGDTIATIKHTSCGAARGVQRQHSLDVHVHGGHIKGFKHDLGHPFTVGFGVEGRLGEKNRVLFRGNTQLVVEGVVPNLLHIIPVGDNAVLDWVLQGEHASLGLCLVSHVSILLVHADHNARVFWSTDDTGKYSSGGVVTGETSLAHSGTIVHH